MSEMQLLVTLLSLSGLASTSQPPYDCSAIQAGNSQFNLSALGGDYEVNGVIDGTTKTTYAINICEDLNSVFCAHTSFCPTSGNVWAIYKNADGDGQFTVSDIDTLLGRSHPHAVRPKAKQLEDGKGLALEFFSEWPYTPRRVTVIDFICDQDSSGLEHLKRTGYNPNWVTKGDWDKKTDRNDTQRQTPSLRFLNWTKDNQDRLLLHLEWRTFLACGSHVSNVTEGSLDDAFMRQREQLRLGV